MAESLKIKQAILEAHIGEDVTVVLGDGGQSSVFQGVLQKESLQLDALQEAWAIISPRAMVHQGGTPIVVPETKVYFSADQLGHLVVRQETQEEAVEKLDQKERLNKTSGLVGPSGSIMQ